MKIEINVYGNPGLNKSLRDALETESTSHSTASGAARRLLSLNHKSEAWTRACGHWGGWKIKINGEGLDEFEDAFISNILFDDSIMSADKMRMIQKALLDIVRQGE